MRGRRRTWIQFGIGPLANGRKSGRLTRVGLVVVARISLAREQGILDAVDHLPLVIEGVGRNGRGRRGFGGACFPKDTTALESIAKKIAVETTMLSTAISTNKKYR